MMRADHGNSSIIRALHNARTLPQQTLRTAPPSTARSHIHEHDPAMSTALLSACHCAPRTRASKQTRPRTIRTHVAASTDVAQQAPETTMLGKSSRAPRAIASLFALCQRPGSTDQRERLLLTESPLDTQRSPRLNRRCGCLGVGRRVLELRERLRREGHRGGVLAA